MKYAPVILFVYNRPEHSRQTLEALKKNQFAPHTRLIVYSDGAPDEINKFIFSRDYGIRHFKSTVSS